MGHTHQVFGQVKMTKYQRNLKQIVELVDRWKLSKIIRVRVKSLIVYFFKVSRIQLRNKK